MEPPKRRHLSMFRSYTVADLFTLANASCGMLAIFLCLEYVALEGRQLLWLVFLLIPLALAFDLLDGWVARRERSRQSVLGADLDSLSDIISFGVAVAVLGYTLGLRGGWDIVCLIYFVVCGISRLARFNVTASMLADPESGKVKYFEGTPIPSSVLIVLLFWIAWMLGRVDQQLWFGRVTLGPADWHPLSLIYLVSGSAMISATLRIPKP